MSRFKRFRRVAGTLLGTAVITGLVSASGVTAEGQVPRVIDAYFTPMHYVFDGKEFAPPEEQQGFIYEGSTYVPLRFISYALNHSVGWDQETYTVTIGKPSLEEQSLINEYRLNRQVHGGKGEAVDPADIVPTDLEVYAEKVTYVFNGKVKLPAEDLPGFIRDGSLYVPMRFFAESVERKLDWDPITYSVIAETDPAVVATPSPSPTVKPSPSATPSPTPSPTPTAAPSASPTPSNTPPPSGAGGFVGGGGGGAVSTPVKPSYDSLIASAESKSRALQAEAQSKFLGLVLEYRGASAAVKKNIVDRGYAALAGYDTRFAAIVAELGAQLSQYGYSTDILADIQAEYENLKSVAIAGLGSL